MGPEERLKLLDELGELEERLAPLDADAKRRKLLREAARKWPAEDKVAPERAFSYKSEKFVLTLGLQENETRIVSMEAVFKALKKARFLAACSFTLKALKDLLPDTWHGFVTTARTGTREFTIARI